MIRYFLVMNLKLERIRELREDRDLTQAQMAKYLGCTQVCYSNYELGKRDIPLEQLIRLADYYQVTVDYLLGRGEDRQP